ncbi:MAG: hypothetical protein IPL46_17950 [Saprospiraceae bacterium]|nr:hypothetical protein [Saprospiraceae bacterium]
MQIQDHQVVDQEIILQGVGRVRDIKQLRWIDLYRSTRPDKILRLSGCCSSRKLTNIQ